MIQWKSLVEKATGVFCELRGKKIAKQREARNAKEASQRESNNLAPFVAFALFDTLFA